MKDAICNFTVDHHESIEGPESLIDLNFNSLCHSVPLTIPWTNTDNPIEFQLQLSESESVHTVYIANRYDDSNNRIGQSEIWVGDDTKPYATSSSNPGLKQCNDKVFDSGFFELDQNVDGQMCKGFVIAFRKYYNPVYDNPVLRQSTDEQGVNTT